jgi:lysine 2,3-aminomutase
MSNRERALRTPRELAEAGLIAPENAAALGPVAQRYAVAVTPDLARLIDPADDADPIGRQFLPDARELTVLPHELADPIGDGPHSPVAGIVHRYPDRVLLKIVGTCPVYCRFCFRREMVGPEAGGNLTPPQVEAALAYIRATPAIFEVIVTGGDPFVLSPRRVRDLMDALAAVPHVAVVRWHTRVPVAAPRRVTPELVAALASGAKTVYAAVHVNHPRELTADARAALARLAAGGVALVSQSVLLRGVNDDADTLEELMRALLAARVKPYYLHHPDLAPGTSHFRLPLSRGIALMGALRRRLSGLALPTYVLDLPGGYGKVPVESARVRLSEDGAVIVDREGRAHHYRDL